jgi:hypothetical protein
VSSDGHYLYVQAGAAGNVDAYRIGPGGTPTETGSITVPGAVGGEGIAGNLTASSPGTRAAPGPATPDWPRCCPAAVPSRRHVDEEKVMSHHFDSPTAIEGGRLNLGGLYVFPESPGTSTLVVTVNPDAGRSNPVTFRPYACTSS